MSENTYLEKVHAKNFRQFEELDVTFNPGFNFITGPNGCGKTSILACISHCFSYHGTMYSRIGEHTAFWTDLILNGQKTRVGINAGSFRPEVYRRTSILIHKSPDASEGRKIFLPHDEDLKSLHACPLVLGAHRSIQYKQINGMVREPDRSLRQNEFQSQVTNSLYGDVKQDIKQWFVNRDFIIEKKWAAEEKTNFEHLIASLPEIGPFDSNFTYVRTGRDLEPVFSIYGKECYLEELSSGFQAILTIIANIFEWVEGSRPEGSRIVADALGTVLIDELDLHLHPEWQFTLRNGLERIFPNLQFIVTTHSPHLLASAKNGEVIVMPTSQSRNIVNVGPSEKRYSGWNTDQILQEVMGVQSLINKDYERLIQVALNELDKGEIEGLRDAIANLSLVTHPSDTIVMVLNAKLASIIAKSHD